MKLKHVAHFVAGGTPDTNNEQFWSKQGIPWVSIGDMSAVEVVTSTAKSLTKAGVRDRRLTLGEPGTVLFAMYASVGAVATLGIAATWNQALLGIVPKPQRADPRFVAYWLKHYAPEAAAEARSATQANLNAEQVANFPFTEMGLFEQRRIADFLDERVSRIDRIITARREQMTVAMRSLEAAVFAECAGKPKVPLRRVTSGIQTGGTPSSEADLEDGTPWYSPASFNGDLQLGAPVRRIQAGFGTPFHSGSVLLVAIGATAGKVAWLDHAASGNQQLTSIHPTSDVLDGRFLLHQLNARSDELRRSAPAATLPILNNELVKAFPVWVPSVPEQKRLIAEWDERLDRQQSLRRSLNRSIDLLTEYKSSLIAAVVTGQLDVTTAGSTIPG